MVLFNKKKDLILKITNLVLSLWLILVTILFYSSIINMVIPARQLSFDEYESMNCVGLETDQSCEDMYANYKTATNNNGYFQKRELFIELSAILIVSGTIYLLNKGKANGDK